MLTTTPVNYQLALFDFDGTLADSFPFFISVFNQVAREHRFKTIAPEQIEGMRGYTAREMMKHVGLPRWRLPFVARRFVGLMKKSGDGIALFDGIGEVLDFLHAHDVRIAIVTANSYDNVARILGPEHLGKIAWVECGASIFGKASKIARVLKQAGIPAQRAIYIGDQTADLDAARQARVAFGAVSWGYATLESLRAHAPDREFHAVADLKRIAPTGVTNLAGLAGALH